MKIQNRQTGSSNSETTPFSQSQEKYNDNTGIIYKYISYLQYILFIFLKPYNRPSMVFHILNTFPTFNCKNFNIGATGNDDIPAVKIQV